MRFLFLKNYRFSALESKLEGIENVYLIMKNIPVPVSTEDSNSLKSLRSQIKAIGGKVTTKVRAQSDILQRFEHTMATEQEALRETITSLFQVRCLTFSDFLSKRLEITLDCFASPHFMGNCI